VQPLKQWAQDFRQEVAPHAQTVRTLGAMADRVPYVVLMVDDDDFQCKMVTRLLAGEPYQVLCANVATTAFAMLSKTRPDVILMDLRMPDIDGIEVTRRLKSVPHFAAIPVIMLTGKSEGEAVIKSRQAGACDFIVKPTDKSTLLMKIAQAMRGKAAA
jgi:CheY-like chemotaxis protein